MNDEYESPTVVEVLGGTFLILFGLGFVLAGGVCTVGWLWSLLPFSSPSELGGEFAVVMLLVSLACLAFGLLCVAGGRKVARGPRRERREPDSRGPDDSPPA